MQEYQFLFLSHFNPPPLFNAFNCEIHVTSIRKTKLEMALKSGKSSSQSC